MPPTKPDFDGILSSLVNGGVEFVLVGGLAMVLQGSDYVTQDVDIAIARTRQTAKALAEALRPFKPRPVDFPSDAPFVWDEVTIANASLLTLETTLGRLDILGEVQGVESYAGLFERARDLHVFGHILKVASIQDLIAMKSAAGRPKDKAHILELEALEKLVDEAR